MNRLRLALFVVALVVLVAVVAAGRAVHARFLLEVQATAADDRRAADVVAGVVDSSLEELRLRESARPFDHYNPVYRPEGVVAASDALAPSPLSRAPDDERLLGWAQLNPDGTTTMPFTATRPEVASALLATLSTSAFAPLRGRTREARTPLLAAAAPTAATKTTASWSLSGATDEDGAGNDQKLALNERDAKNSVVQRLNDASSDVYSKLQQAEAVPAQRAALASNSKLPKAIPISNCTTNRRYGRT